MTTLITPEFRVSYAHVMKPHFNEMNKKDEFSLTALFPKGADIAALRAAADAAGAKKWGPDWKTKIVNKNFKDPFHDHEERRKEGKLPQGFESGAIYMTLKSKDRPGLVDRNREHITKEENFYSGCYARAMIQFFAFDVAGAKGISAALHHVQKTREGDVLSSKPKVEDAFDAIADNDQNAPFMK